MSSQNKSFLHHLLREDIWFIIQRYCHTPHLKKKKTTIRWKKFNEYTSVFRAVSQGYVNMILHKPKMMSSLCEYHLVEAVRKNRIDIVKSIFDDELDTYFGIFRINSSGKLLIESILCNNVEILHFLHDKGAKLDPLELIKENKLIARDKLKYKSRKFSREIIDFLVNQYPKAIVHGVVESLIDGEQDAVYLKKIMQLVLKNDPKGSVDLRISNLEFAKLCHEHKPIDADKFWRSLSAIIKADNLKMVQWYQQLGFHIDKVPVRYYLDTMFTCVRVSMKLSHRLVPWLLKTSEKFVEFIEDCTIELDNPHFVETIVKQSLKSHKPKDMIQRLEMLSDLGIRFQNVGDAIVTTDSIIMARYLLEYAKKRNSPYFEVLQRGESSPIQCFLLRYVHHHLTWETPLTIHSPFFRTTITDVNPPIFFCNLSFNIFIQNPWACANWYYHNHLVEYMKQVGFTKISQIDSAVRMFNDMSIKTVDENLTRRELINCHKILYPVFFDLLETDGKSYLVDLTTRLAKQIIEKSLDDLIDFYVGYGLINYHEFTIFAVRANNIDMFEKICRIKPEMEFCALSYLKGMTDARDYSHEKILLDCLTNFKDMIRNNNRLD